MDIDYIAIGELPEVEEIPEGADMMISDEGSAARLPLSVLKADVASSLAPWRGSQGEYDALPIHSPERLYVILEVADTLSVTTVPKKTVYAVGERLDFEGLAVFVSYPSGTRADVTDLCTFTPDEETLLDTEGTIIITASYSEGGTTLSTTFEITVTALSAEE